MTQVERKDLDHRPKFSISMATCERAYILPFSIGSVLRQFYTNWELIVVVDGPQKDNTEELLKKYTERDDRIKVVNLPKRRERYIAFQAGIDAATGDWVTIMGSDNYLSPFYLYYFKEGMQNYPGYNLYHCGAVEWDRFGNRMRQPRGFKEEGEGFEHFNTGLIGAGEFIWKKELMNEETRLPNTTNPWEAADLAKIEGYGNKIRPLGDPFGEDYWLFYKMTRKNKSKALNFYGSFVWHDIEGWFDQLNTPVPEFPEIDPVNTQVPKEVSTLKVIMNPDTGEIVEEKPEEKKPEEIIVEAPSIPENKPTVKNELEEWLGGQTVSSSV